MRIFTKLIAVAIIAMIQASCFAMTASDYTKTRDEEGLRLYINGVGTGYMWANASLVEFKKDPIFCQPVGLPPSSFMDVIDRKLLAMRQNKTFTDSTNVELALLYGLKDSFPCARK